jgi:hypothetical protein
MIQYRIFSASLRLRLKLKIPELLLSPKRIFPSSTQLVRKLSMDLHALGPFIGSITQLHENAAHIRVFSTSLRIPLRNVTFTNTT